MFAAGFGGRRRRVARGRRGPSWCRGALATADRRSPKPSSTNTAEPCAGNVADNPGDLPLVMRGILERAAEHVGADDGLVTITAGDGTTMVAAMLGGLTAEFVDNIDDLIEITAHDEVLSAVAGQADARSAPGRRRAWFDAYASTSVTRVVNQISGLERVADTRAPDGDARAVRPSA